MNRLFIILFVVTTIFSYSCKNKSGSEIQVVTPEEMQELSEINDVQLVDFNSPKNNKEALIESSQNIDCSSPNFDQEIIKLDKSKPVIVYCKSDNASIKCIEKMKDAGFVKISDIDNSFAKWEFKGFEIKSRP